VTAITRSYIGFVQKINVELMMCTVAEGGDILRSIVICYFICCRFLVILMHLHCDDISYTVKKGLPFSRPQPGCH
jgi:hypothetical protein